MSYFTDKGVSGERPSSTEPESGAALVKFVKYLKANVALTCSCTVSATRSSGLLRLTRLEHDVSSAHVANNCEPNAFLARLNLHRLPELLQVTADLLEVPRRHPADHLVLLLWDLH